MILADDDEYESKEFLVDFIKEHVEEGAGWTAFTSLIRT